LIQSLFTPLDKVKGDFGDGAFTYEGTRSRDCAELTLWRTSIYGLEVSGDKRAPMDRSGMIYGFTSPKSKPVAEHLPAILSR
jgi:hypothetical protein